jgi:hypothetical protein
MFIKFNDVRRGRYVVFVEKDILCFSRVWAVGFGEDDDCLD